MSVGTIAAEATPVRNGEVRFRRIDDNMILIVESQVYQLNETGEAVWMLSSGENSVTDIARRIAEDYSVDEEMVQRDVRALLTELEEFGAVSLQ